MVQEEEIRKGPWTEQEDVQLAFYVNLFGDRRWDFIAKVSGLKRTGKSCRLRWVNYLHPGLKRGKMTPLEERLVLQLHAKWGNRWSKIARKLPGRTDNEIKNYWRTHMRKKAQEKKKAINNNTSSSSSSSSSSSGSSTSPAAAAGVDSTKERNFYDTGGNKAAEQQEVYSMDEIWKDIESSDEPLIDCCAGFREEGCTPTMMESPVWDYYYYCPPNNTFSCDDVLMMGGEFMSSFQAN